MNDAKNEYLALQTIISLLKSDLDKDTYNQIQKYINTLIKLSAKINKLSLHDKVIAKKDNIVTKHIAWRLYDLIKENIDKKQNQDNVINITSSAQCYSDNTTLKDKWQNNYDKYYSTIKNAVEETNDKVITYQGNIIKSYYFAISNGKTSTALSVFNEELHYLTNVDSTFDEGVNKYEVTTTFTYDNFCNLLNINPCNITISNIKRDESNRITSLFINDKEYDGITLRKQLGLRSTDFDIKLLDNIKITTKGYGHGVGMSQYGANYLANNNYSYEEIIKYYYKDVEITSIN